MIERIIKAYEIFDDQGKAYLRAFPKFFSQCREL